MHLTTERIRADIREVHLPILLPYPNWVEALNGEKLVPTALVFLDFVVSF